VSDASGAQEARGHRRREAGGDHHPEKSAARESSALDLADQLTDCVLIHVQSPRGVNFIQCWDHPQLYSPAPA